MKPKISIITPSFNQGQYLEQTIESVLSQDYENKELIIVDGGSTDNSVEIIKKYSKHLAWWVSEKDEGQAHAINKGLSKATGGVFNWINSDDYLEPGALSAIGKAFQQNPEASVVCGYTHCFYEETGETSHTYRMGIKRNPTRTLLDIEMNQPGTWYRADILKALGGVNQSLRYVFDDELWMRYLVKYGLEHVLKLDDLLAHFRLHKMSKTVGEGRANFLKERTSIYGFLGQQISVPDFIQAELDGQRSNSNYKSEPWDVKGLNVEKFISHFAAEYQFTYYKNFNYIAAEYSLKKVIEQGDWTWSRDNLALFIKLFLFNRALLNKLRRKS